MEKETLPQKWSELGIKDQAALITAVISFFLGFAMVFTGMFINPVGEIHGSVLTGFGTALLYTAGIFGVAMYFKNGKDELITTIINSVESKVEDAIKKHSSGKEDADE